MMQSMSRNRESYTATIITRHFVGVTFKVGFRYLKTIVASYEVRTPGQMNVNES